MVNSKPFIIGQDKVLDEGQQACVDLLEEALAEAKRGKVQSIGIVLRLPTGYGTAMAGRHAADLFMGCAKLQSEIMAAVEVDGNKKVLHA